MKTWRALVRVDESYPLTGSEVTHVDFVVPAFDSTERIRRTTDQIPSDIVRLIGEGQIYFYAHVNIGAEDKSDIVFESWESSPLENNERRKLSAAEVATLRAEIAEDLEGFGDDR